MHVPQHTFWQKLLILLSSKNMQVRQVLIPINSLLPKAGLAQIYSADHVASIASD